LLQEALDGWKQRWRGITFLTHPCHPPWKDKQVISGQCVGSCKWRATRTAKLSSKLYT
jgi:hypothetical protein